MGIMQLNKQHRKIAKRMTWNNVVLTEGTPMSSNVLYDLCMDDLARRGVKIVERRKAGMLVSMPGALYVPKGWDGRPLWVKATDLAHELVHYRQRETYRFGTFGTRYLDARFRVAVEIPAYAEEISALVCMGATEEVIEHHIREVPRVLREQYSLGTLQWKPTKLFILDELRRRYHATLQLR